MFEMFPKYPVELFYIPIKDNSGNIPESAKLPENTETPKILGKIPERRQPYVYDIDIVVPLKKN